MEKYQDQYNQAKKQGGLAEIKAPDLFKFEKEGQQIVGQLTSVSKYQGDGTADVNKYTFDTDSGSIVCILGVHFDNLINPGKHMGKILAITYLGKIKLSSGRTMNDYKIEIV